MPASEQGVTRDRYTFIPRTLVFLTRGEAVLLLKGAPHKRLWANRYNGVGGHIERGEDLLTAARRELVEETGLHVSDLWLCGTVFIDTGQEIGIAIFVLRGECAGSPVAEPVPSAEGSLEWVPFSQIQAYPLVEDLYTLLPRVLSMRPGDPPFSALYAYDDQDKLLISFGEVPDILKNQPRKADGL
jgi:8-oxo-dGTP diphosphatase